MSGIEQYYRVGDIAEKWRVSPPTIRRLFEDHPDVLILGDRVGTRKKQRYRTLLIPESAVASVAQQLR